MVIQMISREISALALLMATAVAVADYDPPRIWWPGHTVGYTLYGQPKHQYSLVNMLDGDPKTAWMIGPINEIQTSGGSIGRSEPAIYIAVPGRGKIDGIRIMPGYNKSKAIFERNNRITEVEIWDVHQPGGWSVHGDYDQLIAKAEFKDEMGWQVVRFDPVEVDWLQIDIKNWVEGSDDDICISEIQLLRDGKPIDWNLTPVVLSTHGAENAEGSVWNVLRKNGEVIRQAGQFYDPFQINETDRLVASWTSSKTDTIYWILDIETGKFVAETVRMSLKGGLVSSFQATWRDNSVELKVTWFIRGSPTKEETFELGWDDDPRLIHHQHRRRPVP